MSSSPRTPRSKIRYATKQVRQAIKALEFLQELEADTEDEDVKQAAVDLGDSMTQMRKGLKNAQGNVDSWKGKQAKGPKASAPKRMLIDPSAEVLEAMGDPNFLEKMRVMHRRPGLKVTDWLKYALDKTKANASEDASLGFYLMAQGVAVDKDLERDVADALGVNIEDQLMETLDATRMSDLGYEQLWDIFESMDSSNPRNKKHRVELLQHIIQCVEQLRFSMAWLRLTNGDEIKARFEAIQGTYAVKCARNNPPTEPNYSSQDFVTFSGKFKNFRTGAKRIYDTYEAFGSIMIICPLMHVNAFHESRTGVAIKNIVKTWQAVGGEDREKAHNQVLKVVVAVLEGLYGSEGLSKMLEDMESAYLN